MWDSFVAKTRIQPNVTFPILISSNSDEKKKKKVIEKC